MLPGVNPKVSLKVLASAIIGTVALAFANPIHAEDCGTFPPSVEETSGGALSDCHLAAFGEMPLWKGLPNGATQVMRFAFTDGHGLFFRAVTIVERNDGTAELVALGTARRTSIRTSERRLPAYRRQLSPEQVARLEKLAEEAGAWEFEVGNWDGNALSIHCQTLDMERANAEGYRYSTVNISCNRPAKLMPLVDEIVSLAGLKTDGALIY